jgi:hypothetical protein
MTINSSSVQEEEDGGDDAVHVSEQEEAPTSTSTSITSTAASPSLQGISDQISRIHQLQSVHLQGRDKYIRELRHVIDSQRAKLDSKEEEIRRLDREVMELRESLLAVPRRPPGVGGVPNFHVPYPPMLPHRVPLPNPNTTTTPALASAVTASSKLATTKKRRLKPTALPPGKRAPYNYWNNKKWRKEITGFYGFKQSSSKSAADMSVAKYCSSILKKEQISRNFAMKWKRFQGNSFLERDLKISDPEVQQSLDKSFPVVPGEEATFTEGPATTTTKSSSKKCK